MAKRRNAFCRRCGGHRSVVGQMSKAGQCAGCGQERLVNNIQSLTEESGEAYETWRKSVRASARRLSKLL